MRNLDHLSALVSVTFTLLLPFKGPFKEKKKRWSLIYINDQHVIQSRLMLIFIPVLSSLNISAGTLHTACTVIPKTTILEKKLNPFCFIVQSTLKFSATLPLMALVLLLFPFYCCCQNILLIIYFPLPTHSVQCVELSCYSYQLYVQVAYSVVYTFVAHRTV